MRVGHAVLVAALATAACKDDAKQAPASKSEPVVYWLTCQNALHSATDEMPWGRASSVIRGCNVCGDLRPILEWNTPTAEGGPKRSEIEAAMEACDAFCSGEARLKFLGTLDNARGKNSRTPWRQLGEICKDKVSALPDLRFVDGQYFALDRVARAAAARGGETARLLAKIEIPLPPVTFVGTGVTLPELRLSLRSHAPPGDRIMPVPIGGPQVTVLGESIHVGRLPFARLGPNGVTPDLGPDGYPGRAVPIADLGSALQKLMDDDDDRKNRITLIAPQAMAARRLVRIIAAAASVAPVHLAVRGYDDLPAAIPIELVEAADSTIPITAEMTVQQLATELANRVRQNPLAVDFNRIGVTAQ